MKNSVKNDFSVKAHPYDVADFPEISPNFSNLVDILRYRALHQPGKLAFTFLLDGETEAGSLTYQELDRKTRAIAAQLQSLGSTGITPSYQTKALLLYPAGLEYIAAFFGCLYAGVVAIPAYPPRANRSLSRLQAIVADAEATVALTTTSTLANVERQLAEAPELKALHWVTTDNIASDLAQEWQAPEVSSDTLAFFQYTSGSTGFPKGVMVSHGNLLHNSADLDYGWQHTSDSVIVTWLPIFHDMGLIYGVLQPLYKGIPCYLMAPESFMQKPIRWLQVISRYQATHSGAPNFAYDLCVRRTTPEQRKSLDLSSWCMALNGAESVRKETLERFAEAFKPSGFSLGAFCPGYGLAEATLKVTAVRKTDMPVFLTVQADALEQNRVVEAAKHQQKVQTLVGCGRPALDTKVVIVHPESLTQCAPDEVGEIWVSGSSITQGYWNRPEDTANTFWAFLEDTGEGPFFRTGDLGFLKDGELFVTGRLKDVIIIRGRNHYPQDIELTVEQSHPALRPSCGAAFAVAIAGLEQLAIAQEVERSYLRKLDFDEVVEAIRRAVAAQHELEVYAVLLLKTGSIPKTSSGKIQRRACKAEFLRGNLNTVFEWIQSPRNSIETFFSRDNSDERSPSQKQSPTEEAIQRWLVSYLSARLLVEPQEIDVRFPLENYRLDSAEMLSLTGALEDWLGRRLSLKLVYEYPTIEKLAQHLADESASRLQQQSQIEKAITTS